MAFNVVSAGDGDAREIAEIHLQAMDYNALVHAQFPNPDSLAFLRGYLEKETVEHVQDNDKGVLVARDSGTGETGGFVKWLVHCEQNAKSAGEEKAQAETTTQWPAYVRGEYLESYGQLTAILRKEAMGDSPYYRKSKAAAWLVFFAIRLDHLRSSNH